MLQVSPPIAQELLARYLNQGRALSERATLVGDLSDYEAWKAERRQWSEQTAQALVHIYDASSEASAQFRHAASPGGGGPRWQQQYASDLATVRAATEMLASLAGELRPVHERDASPEYSAEHADAVALVHAEDPTPEEQPHGYAQSEANLRSAEWAERAHAYAPAARPEEDERPLLAEVPKPQQQPDAQRQAPLVGAALEPASTNGAAELEPASTNGAELAAAAANGAEVVSQPAKEPVSLPDRMRQVFLAHGRDEKWMRAVARLLERSGPHTVTVLNERPSDRRALAEKFEEQVAGSHYAVVLLTADDVGAPRLQSDAEPYYSPRARQGVVFEMGFLVAALTPGCVCVLYEDGVEMPCDLDGIAYVRLDYAGTWQSKLLLQLRKAGFNYDLNKLAPV